MTHRDDLVLSGYPEVAYGGYSGVDGTVAFYSRIQALLPPHGVVLDVGCGRGGSAADACQYRRVLTDLRGGDRHVIGLDIDPEAATNPRVNEFRLIDASFVWPVADASATMAVADNVLEHLQDPASFFAELARVLAPGGVACFRTPNRIGYVGLLSRVVPNSLHRPVVVAVGGREERDVFPAYYRANRPGTIRKLMRPAFREVVVIPFEGEPSYFRFSRVAYRIMSLVHRVIPAPMRATLQVFATRAS